MEFLIHLFHTTKTLHHAYLLEGKIESIREKLLHFIQHTLKIPIQSNPDIWHSTHDTFTIDEARTLREIQSNKALSATKKIFIIELLSMTIEAQNALLKMFEEPTPDTHFFIITPSSHIFLPTFQSRVLIISDNEASSSYPESKGFLKASPAERLKTVEEIVEEKDKGRAVKLVDGIIDILHTRKSDPSLMNELLMVRKYLNDRSSSLKLLLEHISLIV